MLIFIKFETNKKKKHLGNLAIKALQIRTLFGLFNFFDSSVTDETFVDETRVWREYKISILVSMMSLIYKSHFNMKHLFVKLLRKKTNSIAYQILT